MSLERFCRKEVATTGTNDTIVDAARRMQEKHVGAVVVVDRAGRPVGMVTDRDIACRIIAEGRDPATTKVESAMSRELVTVRHDPKVASDAALELAVAEAGYEAHLDCVETASADDLRGPLARLFGRLQTVHVKENLE